jgi:hypothetical protein
MRITASGSFKMSVEVELNGKAGRVCQPAIQGSLHCPLIVRQSSEDVMTGNVFGSLMHIRPHLWLNALLNRGLGEFLFCQVWFKNLTIRLWERQARFPPELLSFKEGRTEPDVIIEWENPPISVWIEAKWQSPIAKLTSHSEANDQAFRGIRTLLHSVGRMHSARLFHAPVRRPIWLALLADKTDSIVDQYRDQKHLVTELAKCGGPMLMPEHPFVGILTWYEILEMLIDQIPQMLPTERSVASKLIEYLQLKLSQLNSRSIDGRRPSNQYDLISDTLQASRCSEKATQGRSSIALAVLGTSTFPAEADNPS